MFGPPSEALLIWECNAKANKYHWFVFSAFGSDRSESVPIQMQILVVPAAGSPRRILFSGIKLGKVDDGQIWLLDSQEIPKAYSFGEYVRFLLAYRNAFVVADES